MDQDKAREQELLKLADTAIRATGQAAEGAFAGAGLAMQGYLSGDALAFAAKSAAGFIFLEWFVYNFPNFARTTHLDRYPGAPVQLPPTDPALGPYGIRVFYFNGHNEFLAYDTPELRDQAMSTISSDAYELLHGISEIHPAQRLVFSGRDGPFPNSSSADIRISQLAYQGISSHLISQGDQYYVVYTPYVGPWT